MGRRKILFDTHGSFKKLVAGGMSRQQADANVCLLIRLIGQKIASDAALDALGLKSPAIGGGTQGVETCQIGGPKANAAFRSMPEESLVATIDLASAFMHFPKSGMGLRPHRRGWTTYSGIAPTCAPASPVG